MNDNLEEIYQLIEEIENDIKQGEIEKEERIKKYYQNKIKNKRFKEVRYFLSLFLFGFNTSLFFHYLSSSSIPNTSKNYFSANKVIASNEDVAEAINNLEEIFREEIPLKKQNAYLVLDSIVQNQNLNKQEKDIAYDLLPIIEENPYLNKETAYRNLLNLDIKFAAERPEYYKKTTAGDYSYYKHKINIYYDYETETEEDFDILRHELIHCIYINSYTENLPRSFKEGMTELLTNEYYSNKPYEEIVSYPFLVLYVKTLCEITSPDTVLKAFSYGDMNIIYEAMSNIKGTKEEAQELLNKIDTILLKALDEESLTNEPVQEVLDKISTYKNTNTANDMLSYYKYLLSSLTQEKYYEVYFQRIFAKPSLKKAYFSKNLIEKNEKEKTYYKSY